MRRLPVYLLIDVSGSMNNADKLPLLKQGFGLLVEQLTERDRVSIVVYAGSAGLVLPSTPGNEKATILDALDRLQAGGSTAGGAGIQLAYKQAQENFISGGNNRIILATDGDFNVGASSEAELVRMIEQKREEGVFLSILGFFFFNTQMHERYSHPAMLMAFLYGILNKNYWIYGITSIAYFLNMEKTLMITTKL